MMVIYLPVKFDSIGHSVFELESRNRNVDGETNGQKNGQTNGQNYSNFVRNLAMMVIYLPVKFEFDWTQHFRVRVRKRTQHLRVRVRKQRTNERRELHQFQKKPSCNGDLCACQV